MNKQHFPDMTSIRPLFLAGWIAAQQQEIVDFSSGLSMFKLCFDQYSTSVCMVFDQCAALHLFPSPRSRVEVNTWDIAWG
jgi:hypothetical protein